jgi:DNA-binding LacI/PurR family transcriptional regulator/signal transduction histidine kinase
MLNAGEKNGERKTIGVFTSRLGKLSGPEFIAGVIDAAEEKDHNLICFVGGKPVAVETPDNPIPSYGLYDIARTRQLAGLIVSSDLGYELDSDGIKRFLHNYSHLPMIANACQVIGVPNLVCDNLRGMRMALAHLFDAHAFTRVAFICGPANHPEAEERLIAYQLELSERGLPFDANLVVPGDFSTESGRAAIAILLDERKLRPQAIAAANDNMAIGAYEALQLRGIQVPGEIALTGFDDISEARSLGVPLTTVSQPFYAMGQRSVDMLLRRLDGGTSPVRFVMPTRLQVRCTCGCLPMSVQAVIGKEIAVDTLQNQGPTIAPRLIPDLLAAVDLPAEDPRAGFFEQSGERLWQALQTVLHEQQDAALFFSSLEAFFLGLARYSDDLSLWHLMVSILRRYALVATPDLQSIRRAEDLFQQTRILTIEFFQRQQSIKRLRLVEQEEILQQFSSALASVMSLEEIGSAVGQHFPRMGISRMYVMLYSSTITPETTLVPPSDNYHLVMQYDEQGFQIPVDRPKWATGYLIPRGKTPENRRYSAIVMPLSLARKGFGFLWIEMNARDAEVYIRLRNLISAALFRTSLVEQRALMQKQVEHLLQESQLREMELAIANETAERTAEENARLYSSELERREAAENLSKVARSLSTILRLDELPGQLLEQLANLLPYERGALLVESPDGAAHIVAYQGFPEHAGEVDLLPLVDGNGAYARIVQSGEPIIIDDVTADPAWQTTDWLPLNHAWMGVPLFAKNRVIGMLALTRQEAGAFSHDELIQVMTFGLQAAISLENARLYDEVTRFNESLERVVAERVEELRLAYNKLEQLDKNKTSFIQVTAHELRTPLTVMKGYLGMLKGMPEIQSNEMIAQAVGGVLKGSDRLHLIVNSMLDVARLENQVITPSIGTVIISMLFQQVEKEYKNDLQERNIKLVYEAGVGSLPFVKADPELLQKALDAVFVNAIKYTPDGGSISLGGREVLDDQLGPCLDFHVRDTGIGIDPANHQIVFEKLFQLGKVELHSSGRTKFKGGGPGLGLAIAAAIIKAHRGKIWVESPAYDEQTMPGSTFFIRLPMAKP